jgi:hypothetical protein
VLSALFLFLFLCRSAATTGGASCRVAIFSSSTLRATDAMFLSRAWRKTSSGCFGHRLNDRPIATASVRGSFILSDGCDVYGAATSRAAAQLTI